MNTRATSATTSRLCLAFLLTPLLPPFYGALFFAQPWALPIGLMVTYPSALVFGLPSFLLWVRRFRQWWVFAVWGAACSLPALITYAVRQDVPHLESFSLINGAIVLGWGTFAGLCFWLLGIAGDSPLRWRDVLDMGPPST